MVERVHVHAGVCKYVRVYRGRVGVGKFHVQVELDEGWNGIINLGRQTGRAVVSA